MVLNLLFKSLIDFEFILTCSMRRGPTSFFFFSYEETWKHQVKQEKQDAEQCIQCEIFHIKILNAPNNTPYCS